MDIIERFKKTFLINTDQFKSTKIKKFFQCDINKIILKKNHASEITSQSKCMLQVYNGRHIKIKCKLLFMLYSNIYMLTAMLIFSELLVSLFC